MRVLREVVSPDGALTFWVTQEDSDTALGFRGGCWHTHPEVLAAEYDLDADAAVERFVEELLSGRLLIAISRVDGAIEDIWVTDDPDRELKYKPDNESLVFRRWNDALPAS